MSRLHVFVAGDHLGVNLCELGHVATTAQLLALGWNRGSIAKAPIVRVRQGAYCCAHLTGPMRTAAQVGGSLTCVSILREAEVWSGHDYRIHLQVPSSASNRRGRARLHWEPPRFGMDGPLRASRMQSLWQALRCLPTEHAIAAMESAIKKEFLTEAEVRRLGVLAPRRLQPGIQSLINNSGSGNETIVRLRLLAVGYSLVPQGKLPGAGHQDLVIEDRVGLEVDSATWHGEQIRALDYERDLISEGLGRPVLRILPAHVHNSWPQTLSVIDRMVRDAGRR